MKRLVFDIETTKNDKSLALAPEPRAAGNLKDPEKIAADIASKKAEQIDRAALDPDYGQIRAIGMSKITVGQRSIEVLESVTLVVPNDVSPFDRESFEHGVLFNFWNALSDCEGRAIGYNILGFDIPFLLRRSMALGVKVPLFLNLAKYRVDPLTDLMGILYNWGPAKGLKDVAKLYGIRVPKEGVTGADVANLSDKDVEEYVASDVAVTTDLLRLMNGVYFNLY